MDKTLTGIKEFFTDNMTQFIFAVLLIIVGYVLAKLLIRLLKKILFASKMEHTVATFIVSMTKVILYPFVVVTSLSTVGVNVTSLIAALSALALTAGLALKDSLGNVASGLVILLNKPFVAGDILEFEGIKGTVSSIRIFSTTINTLDNKRVTIPNSRLTANNVVNCTMVEKRRLDLSYTISYDEDIDKVKELLYSLAENVDKVLKDPQPSVHIGKYFDSGIEVIVWLWIIPDDYFDVYFYMQENVKKLFDDNGITIPYPHMVVKEEKANS